MLAVLDKPLRRLQELYDRSAVRRFLSWWKAELLGCLPVRWRERLVAPPLEVRAQCVEGGLHLTRMRGEATLDVCDVTDPDTQIGLVQRFVQDEALPAEQVWLTLAASRVLRRRLVLPSAAEENLRQILAFEMDRQTPFKADQVYFDQRIVRRDLKQSQIVVEIAVVPRPLMDAEVEQVRRYRLALDGVDAMHPKHPGMRAGFNLLEARQRTQRVDAQRRINWILGCAMVALLYTAMSQHLQARRAALETLQEEVASEEQAAAEVRKLEAQVRDAITGSSFLTDRKCNSPQVIQVMLELTQRLPDDTWLERLSFISRQVQIQGQSAEANKLIGLLQNARTVANPQVQGVIQPDPGTQKDRFTIQLDQRTGAACASESEVAAESPAERLPQPAVESDDDVSASETGGAP